jgi:hypothetical protein
MTRQMALGQALGAILRFAAPAHERSQQSRDESKKPTSVTGSAQFSVRVLEQYSYGADRHWNVRDPIQFEFARS